MQQLIGFLGLAIGYICSIAGTQQSAQIGAKERQIVAYTQVAGRIDFDSLTSAYAFNKKVFAHVDSLRSELKHGHTQAIDFIFNHAHIAREIELLHGIPAEITLSVAMYESGFGWSRLAIEGRNYFGLKKGSYGGLTIELDGSVWRAYNDTQECFDDFAQVICEHYPHIASPNATPTDFAATGWNGKPKQYRKHLEQIISRYNLQELFKKS